MPVFGSRDIGRHPRANCLDQELQVGDGRLREHPMTEVEDVAGTTAGTAKDIACSLAHELGWAQEHGRVQVALDTEV
jgi:hypothetical protein